jgi:hypothetical protein
LCAHSNDPEVCPWGRNLQSPLVQVYVHNFWGFLPLSALGSNPTLATKPPRSSSPCRNFLNELNVPFHEHFFGQTFGAIGWNFSTTPAPWIGFKPVKRRLALAVLKWLPQQAQLETDD